MLLSFLSRGNFEHISTHAELLFRCSGTFEEYASSGWGYTKKAQLFGPLSNNAPHRTDSDARYHTMVTPQIQANVFRHFKADYDMFRRIKAQPFNISYVVSPKV
jgi:hypothetical protein